MDIIKKFKLIMDSYNYAKNYLEINACMYCCEKKCDCNCIIFLAKENLNINSEIYHDATEILSLTRKGEN